MRAKSIVAGILLVLLCGAGAFGQTKRRLTRAEAAEKFISYVRVLGWAEGLESKPLAVKRGNRYFKDGWGAFFRYKRPGRGSPRNLGHLFYMDAYGENITDEHMDIIYTGGRRGRRSRR